MDYLRPAAVKAGILAVGERRRFSFHCMRHSAREILGILSIPMEEMVGTWGLEPQTSTVSILRSTT